MIRIAIAAALLCTASTAQARWLEATTPNFKVYGDMPEPKLREWATNLEKYDKLLRALSNIQKPPSENPLEIYLVRDSKAVHQALSIPGSGVVGGFYSAPERGPFFVGSSGLIGERTTGLDGKHVLQHEYTHHFMFQFSPAAYPLWYSEGFAELYGMAEFGKGNEVEVGALPYGRISNLNDFPWVPIDKMLGSDNSKLSGVEFAMLYAEGWLLLHMAVFDPELNKQMKVYLAAINNHEGQQVAYKKAFGEKGGRKLEERLHDYLDGRRFKALRLALTDTNVGEIKVRPLTDAEDAMIVEDYTFNSGMSPSAARAFAADVRKSASRFPNDPFALRLLAEVELDMKNYDAAIAAADKLYAVAPTNARGLAVKGIALMEKLRDAGDYDKTRWEAARSWLIKSNRADPSDAYSLQNYYLSFKHQNIEPTKNAVDALIRSMDLIPQSADIRYEVASYLEDKDRLEDATTVIMPIASDPHSDDEDEQEKKKKKGEEDLTVRTIHKKASDMLDRLQQKQANTWTDAEETAYQQLLKEEKTKEEKARLKRV